MPPSPPLGKCSVSIEGFGRLDGWKYEGGIRQFCGVPYASLSKRWTRSTLKTRLESGCHDGTRLGPMCPNPSFDGDDTDDLVPVPPFPHFNQPSVDERSALVMNIVLPPPAHSVECPILVYVHGGSLLYGGAFLPIFDSVKLVSQSVTTGKPIIVINFNYRVGLGGFLAGNAIRNELERDGHAGCGNFGFTDQQVFFEWVQRFGSSLGGDVSNVTAVGESAGGISISSQLLAKNPPKIRRAVCMSGLAISIPAWTMVQHEKLFTSLCSHFELESKQPDILDRLRAIPEQQIANATFEIFGALSGTGNPCLDDWWFAKSPLEIHEAPSWLQAYMIGDVYHEGVIFHLSVMDDNFDFWRTTLLEHLPDPILVDKILGMYNIHPGLPQDELVRRFEHMAGDAVFKIPNYVTARYNTRLDEADSLFLYHFDQISRIRNTFEGTAYHAHELLYLFRNLEDEMNDEECGMAWDFAQAWINFTNGIPPWSSTPREGGASWKWKVWGPNSKQGVLSEPEDEATRDYTRFEEMLAIGEPGQTWKLWLNGIDAIVNKRMNLGTKLSTL